MLLLSILNVPWAPSDMKKGGVVVLMLLALLQPLVQSQLNVPEDLCSEQFRCADKDTSSCKCDRYCAYYGDCCNQQLIDPSKVNSYDVIYGFANLRVRRNKESGIIFSDDDDENPLLDDNDKMLSTPGVPIFDLPSRNVFRCSDDNLMMISKCSPRMAKRSGVVWDRCEHSELSKDDPFSNIPALDPETNITYKNYYCALCNGQRYQGLKFWKTVVQCPELEKKPDRGRSFEDELVYNKEHESWGIWLYEDSIKFTKCAIAPWNDIDYKPRTCFKHLVSECPASWESKEDIDKCSSTGFLPVFTQQTNYKNVYCAFCNGEDIETVSCFPTKGNHTVKSAPSFGVLIDVNDESSDRVGKILKCKEGQVTFSGKCKTLSCGIPGYVMRDGRCVQP